MACTSKQIPYILLINFCLFVSFALCRRSGIYVDNGYDQTIVQKFLSRQEKRELEHELLNLLGLPSRPRPKVHPRLTKSAPKFLIDVYDSLENHVSITRNEFAVSGDDQRAIDESDYIMSFPLQNRHVDEIRHESGRRLWFDVSEVAIEDNILGSELRVFQQKNSTRHKHGNFIVTLYEVYHNNNGDQMLKYVDSLNTTGTNDGWLVFNVTGPLLTWVAIPDLNFGLYLSITSHNNPSREIKPERIGLIHRGEEDHQPFMVAFFKSSGIREARIRKTRQAQAPNVSRKRKKKSHMDSGYRNPLLHNPSQWTTRSCQMHNLYISFRDLKWHEWIIAPDGYQAFYCSGECAFPLNAHMNATNHAIVQTLVHLIQPNKVPKPSCAPTKLSPISVLYFSEESNVMLRKYKNMAVKSCGCH